MDLTLSNVTFMQILVFLAVAEEKGFAKAAARLHMTQPAVSKSIAKLEAALSIRLFCRTTRSLELTESGAMLFEHFKPSIEAMQKSLHAVKTFEYQNKMSVRVALINTADPKYFEPYARQFRNLYPDVELNLVSDSLENQRLFLSQYKYDIIFIPDFEHYDLDKLNQPWKWAAKAPAQIIMSKDHPLSHKRSLTLDDIKNEPFNIIDSQQNPSYTRYLKDIFPPGACPIIGRRYYSTNAIHSISKLEGILLTDDFFIPGNTEKFTKRPLENCENGIICAWNEPFRTPYVKKLIELIG